MGAEHLRQRRLHRRRLHRVKHGEHHLHHGYRRQIETGGRKDRRADEHRHGGKRVKRHHDGPTVRTIRHHAAKGREQNRGQDACSKNGGERRRRAGLVKHPHGHGKPQHKVGEERYAETRDEQAEVACAKRISGLASLWFVCVRHRGFLSCDWPRPFIQTDRRSVIVITIRPRKRCGSASTSVTSGCARCGAPGRVSYADAVLSSGVRAVRPSVVRRMSVSSNTGTPMASSIVARQRMRCSMSA